MEERLTRILLLLSEGGEALPGPTRLCQVAAEVTAMDGAGLVLLSDGRFQGVLCGGDVVSETLAELEFALGEGPCLDAWALDGRSSNPTLRALSLRAVAGVRSGRHRCGSEGRFWIPGPRRCGPPRSHRPLPGPDGAAR